MIATKDLYWIAGILEGEGCFTLSGRTSRIALQMGDIDIVEKARNILRPKAVVGTIKIRQPGYKDKHYFYVHGDKAIGWMMTLFPLMGIRRKSRIKELIAKWKDIPLPSTKTGFCSKNHKLNTYSDINGRYICKTCQAELNKKARARRKALVTI